MIQQNISKIVIGSILVNISPSNIFQTTRLFERFHLNHQAAFGCVGTDGLMLSPLFQTCNIEFY